MSWAAKDGCTLTVRNTFLRRLGLGRRSERSGLGSSPRDVSAFSHPRQSWSRPVLIVVDTSYSLKEILGRGQAHSVTCRDLGGFFAHVWTVNPIAPAGYEREVPLSTKVTWYSLSSNSTFIEGTLAVSLLLSKWPGGAALNFLLSQCLHIGQMVSIARSNPLAVIRGGDPLYAGLFALVVASLSERPLVIRVGGNNERVSRETGRPIMPRLFRTRSLERAVEKFVLSRAHAVMGANEDNLAWALASGASRCRSRVVRYGNLIDPVHFHDPGTRALNSERIEEIGVLPGRKILLYVGRIEEVKRVRDLIPVAEMLRSLGIEFQLILVGDGSQSGELQTQIRQRGLQDYVLLAGPLSQKVIADLFAVADVVVSPHMGRALAEAALAAAPIVAYDLDWQGELIHDGETGRLIPVGDVQNFAKSVADLLSSPDEARKLGLAARQTALQLLDPARQDAIEREIYSVLLSRSP